MSAENTAEAGEGDHRDPRIKQQLNNLGGVHYVHIL